MTVFRLTLDGAAGQLRWFHHDATAFDRYHQVGQRPFDVGAFTALSQRIDTDYAVRAPDLLAIGRTLHDFLDGPERWLATARQPGGEVQLLIDIDSPLRHLPWELLADGHGFMAVAAHQRVTPIRWLAGPASAARQGNRPLRLLFMAASPDDVQPVLAFEAEEAAILDEGRLSGIELVVEESGSAKGLAETLELYGPGHFDAVHLTGHAHVIAAGPCFCLEDDLGHVHRVDADDLAKCLRGRWPRLVFLSGCSTGRSGNGMPSLAEDLLRQGHGNVLAWALPVGDGSATQAAANIYHQLAGGLSIVPAVAAGRLALYEKRSPYWHLLRHHMVGPEPGALVTPRRTRGRAQIAIRDAADEFLDARSGQSGTVCSRKRFVGRREVLKRCLRTLRASQGDTGYADGVLVHGLGGLGKSSVAARLCDRLPEHARVVIVGRLDEAALRSVIAQLLGDAAVNQRLGDPATDLAARLRWLLEQPLANRDVLFIFDDFEQNLELDGHGRHVCQPAALQVLAGLMQAIRQARSACRVLVTSRYDFAVPGPGALHREPLDELRGADLKKKLADLASFGGKEPDAVHHRAIELGSGNPRLLEFFDRALQDPAIETVGLLDLLRSAPPENRLHDFLRGLLGLLARQDPDVRRLVAQLAVHRLPVVLEVALATVDVADAERHLQRAVALGVVEGAVEATGTTRYLVPRVVEELVVLDEAELVAAAGRGARAIWPGLSKQGGPEAEWWEVYRLAEAAGDRTTALCAAVGPISAMNDVGRYREALEFTRLLQCWGEDAGLLAQLGRAEAAAGSGAAAQQAFEAAMRLTPADSESAPASVRDNRRYLLMHYADLLVRLGRAEQAEPLLREASGIAADLGDQFHIATAQGRIADILGDRGQFEEALRIYRDEVLPTYERQGNERGKVGAMGRIADMQMTRGELDEALRIRLEEQLPVYKRLGDAHNTAKVVGKIADILVTRRQFDEALRIRREEELPVYERLGDLRSQAVAMAKIAGILTFCGQLDEALSILREEVLPVYHRLGGMHELVVGRTNLAQLLAKRGHAADCEETRQLLLQAFADAQHLRYPEAEQIRGLFQHIFGTDLADQFAQTAAK